MKGAQARYGPFRAGQNRIRYPTHKIPGSRWNFVAWSSTQLSEEESPSSLQTTSEVIATQPPIEMSLAFQSEHAVIAATPAAGGSSPKSHPVKLWSTLNDVFELLRIERPRCVRGDLCRFQHMQFRPRQRIHTIGEPFDTLYVVNGGFLKTVTLDEFGHELVLGFPMKGELIGVESVHRKFYSTEAVALSNCDVILIPFTVFLSLGQDHPALAPSLFAMMSRAIEHEHTTVNLLGALTSEARLARFLVWMSRRFAEMGYSSTEFKLHMTREEIGLYLGSTLETVSRAFSALGSSGLISVKQRSVIIHDLEGLRMLRRLTPARMRLRQNKEAATRRTPGIYASSAISSISTQEP